MSRGRIATDSVLSFLLLGALVLAGLARQASQRRPSMPLREQRPHVHSRSGSETARTTTGNGGWRRACRSLGNLLIVVGIGGLVLLGIDQLRVEHQAASVTAMQPTPHVPGREHSPILPGGTRQAIPVSAERPRPTPLPTEMPRPTPVPTTAGAPTAAVAPETARLTTAVAPETAATPLGAVSPTAISTSTPVPYRPITGLAIPAIQLETEVVPSELVQQQGATTWEVPAFKVGHAAFTAGAGAIGNAVLLGHVESRSLGNVFAQLHLVQVGQRIHVWSGEELFVYEVTAVRTVSRTDLSVLDPADVPMLSLITCTGPWLLLERDYAERLVVQATLVDGGDAPVASAETAAPIELREPEQERGGAARNST